MPAPVDDPETTPASERAETGSAYPAVERDLMTLPGQPTITRWRRWVQTENLGLSLTLGYLFLSGLGMLHRGLVFFRFKINIMDYAEPSDFLVSALRDPLIIIACVAPVPAVALYYKAATALRKRTKTPKWAEGTPEMRAKMDRYRQPLYILTMFLWALAASLHYARRVAEDLRAGKGQRVHVELVSDAGRPAADTTAWLTLGSTHSFMFFYDPTLQVTTVVPAQNVARIRIDRRKPGAK